LQVGEQPQLGRGERQPGGRFRGGAGGQGAAQLFDLAGEGPERRAVDQDVVDLAQKLAGRRQIGEGEVYLGQLQPSADGHGWEHVGG
jgi:hypothetical protein